MFASIVLMCIRIAPLKTCSDGAREHEGTERGTEGVGQDMLMALKLFLVSEVCFPRRPHRLQPRSEVFSEKANFNNNGGFIVGTQTFFVGIQEVSVFRVIQEVSFLFIYFYFFKFYYRLLISLAVKTDLQRLYR